MPVIWCAISGHGFGHAAQVVPVLNELGQRVRDLTAVLRTPVPEWFFQGRLNIPWTRNESEQDIGCVQRGPLWIDVPGTWEELRRFHATWEARVSEEAKMIRSTKPALVLADIPYLAIQAGAQARIPTIGLCSLSWDRILKPFQSDQEPARKDQLQILQHIEQAYAQADLMIQPAPGIPLNAFRQVVEVGPIAQETAPEPARLREILGAAPDERIVLVAFGGVALDSLPFSRMAQMGPYRFVVSEPVPASFKRITAVTSLPLSFRTLLASSDLVMTKPGYSTIVEAVAHHIPVVYVRRYNFADEASLVDYLHQHGRGVELSSGDFEAGQWLDALETAWSLPSSTKPPASPTGAAEAARLLTDYLKE